MNSETYWDKIFTDIDRAISEIDSALPSVSEIARESRDPFRILISTLISLRTKDSVTLAASRKLFSLADSPEGMLSLPQESIEKAIYPAGFYRTKAARIHEISAILRSKYDSKVPNSQKELLQLPGVGIKTANLTLNLGFGIDAICV
ncbi:MAG: endonuclease III, partial [Spirochaetales bacterium]|nr:endonuclease III [Spirochaetales bacterium]